MVLALSGAALLSASCAKDYGEELNSVKKDLAELRGTAIASQGEQIKALTDAADNLKKADEALKQNIADLNTSLTAAKENLQAAINQKADQSTVNTLQNTFNSINSAITSLTGRVAANEATIASINTTLAQKADKSFVEQTYATKDQLTAVSQQLGTLSSTATQTAQSLDAAIKAQDTALKAAKENLQNQINTNKDNLTKEEQARIQQKTDLLNKISDESAIINGTITGVKNDLAGVKATADKAAQDITTIFGEIETIKSTFDNYYTIGEIDGQKDALNQKIDALKDELEAKIDQEILDRGLAIDSLKTAIKDEETARVNAINAEKDAREAAIAVIEETIKKLKEADSLETALRDSSCAALQNAINLANDYIKEVEDSLDAEKDAREIAEATLKALIDGEILRSVDKDGELEQMIADAKTALENADAAEKSARETKDNELASKIEALQAKDVEISGKITSINDEITSIKGRLDALEAKDLELKGKIEDVDSALQNEILARTSLATIVSGNKTSIDSLKTALEGYKTEVATKIADAIADAEGYADNKVAEEAIARDAKIQEKITDILNNEIKANTDAIGVINNDINDIKTTLAAITGSTGTVGKDLGTLTDEVAEVADRVVSISVMPTNDYELQGYTLGATQSTATLVAKFKVEPASAADLFTTSNVELNYMVGVNRSKASTDPNKGIVTDVTNNNGIVTVTAKNLTNVLDKGPTMGCFFALTFKGSDGAGDYTVTSEYARAYENSSKIPLDSYFVLSKDGVTSTNAYDAGVVSLDYIAADTTTYKPFSGYIVMFDGAKAFADHIANFYATDKLLTLPEFDSRTNLSSTWIDEIVTINAPLKEISGSGLEKIIGFEPSMPYTDLFPYVSPTAYEYEIRIKVVGTTIATMKASYQLTKITHDPVNIDLGTIYWNYKHWKDLDRKVSLDAAALNTQTNNVWGDAITHGAKASAELGFDTKATVDFTFDEWTGDYETFLAATGKALPDAETVYTDVMTKTSASDEYTFNVKFTSAAKHESGISKDKGVVDLSDVYGYTVDVPFVLSGISEDLIPAGAVASYCNGLTAPADTIAANVRAAFKTEASAGGYTVEFDGTDVTTSWTIGFNGDELNVTMPAGTMKYNEEKVIKLTCTAFGLEYTYTATLKSGAPKFKLVNNETYVQNGKAEVRGLADGTKEYKIEEMHYTNYWKVEGNFDNEPTATVTIKFTYTEAAASEWGTGTHGAISYATTPLSVDASSHQLAYSEKMSWDTYKATNFKMKATILINDAEVSGAVEADSLSNEVYFWTPDPMKFTNNAVVDSTYYRISGVDLKINLLDKLNVSGYTGNGAEPWTSENLLHKGADGKYDGEFVFDPIWYSGAKLEYDIESSITTESGKTLVKGTDYEYNAAKPYEFVFKGDSAVSQDITFSVKISLRNNLDHCGLASKVPTTTFKITIKQN